MMYAYRKSSRGMVLVEADDEEEAVEILGNHDINVAEEDLVEIERECVIAFEDGEFVPEDSTIDDIAVAELKLDWPDVEEGPPARG